MGRLASFTVKTFVNQLLIYFKVLINIALQVSR